MAVFVIVTQFHEHPQGAEVDAGRKNARLDLSRQGIPVGFHLGVFVFHSITGCSFSCMTAFYVPGREDKPKATRNQRFLVAFGLF